MHLTSIEMIFECLGAVAADKSQFDLLLTNIYLKICAGGGGALIVMKFVKQQGGVRSYLRF